MLVQVELDEVGDLVAVLQDPSQLVSEVSADTLDHTARNGWHSNHHRRSPGPHYSPLLSTAGRHFANSSHLYR